MEGFNGSAVRRPRLVRIRISPSRTQRGFNGSAVRRPRLALTEAHQAEIPAWLQWVRGPKTAVSFGLALLRPLSTSRFNGSAVRRPRLVVPIEAAVRRDVRFNGSAVRRPRLVEAEGGREVRSRASMGPRSEDRG